MHFRFVAIKAPLAVFKPSPAESSVIAVKLKIKSKPLPAAILCAFRFLQNVSLVTLICFFFFFKVLVRKQVFRIIRLYFSSSTGVAVAS